MLIIIKGLTYSPDAGQSHESYLKWAHVPSGLSHDQVIEHVRRKRAEPRREQEEEQEVDREFGTAPASSEEEDRKNLRRFGGGAGAVMSGLVAKRGGDPRGGRVGKRKAPAAPKYGVTPSGQMTMFKAIVVTGLSKAYFTESSLRAYAQRVREAAHRTDRTPTEAQTVAGNYRKGKVRLHGMTISIETPAGATRRGKDRNGKEWAVRLKYPYGYFNRTLGKDGDQVDVIVGPHPEAEFAYVVDQMNADGTFDEHKVVLGALSKDEAREIYLSNYSPGWDRIGAITPVSIPRFKWWLKNHNIRHPFALSMPEALTKAVDSAPTMSKESVHYRKSDNIGKHCCGNCSMFRLHPPDFETGCCTLVKGVIDDRYICDEWESAKKSKEIRKAIVIVGLYKSATEKAERGRLLSVQDLDEIYRKHHYEQGEVCPHCGAVHEEDSHTGKCNSCGKERGGKKVPERWLRKSAPSLVGPSGAVTLRVNLGHSGEPSTVRERTEARSYVLPGTTAIGSIIPRPIIVIGLSKAVKQMRVPAGEEYTNPKTGKRLKGGQFAPQSFVQNAPVITGDEISSSTDPIEVRSAVKAYAKAHLIGKSYVNKHTGKSIRITRSGIDHVSWKPRLEAMKAVAAIPQMLQNATHRLSIPDKDSRNSIKAVHIYDVGLHMGSHLYHVKLTIREDRTGELHYHHKLTKMVEKSIEWATPKVRGAAEAESYVQGQPIGTKIVPLPIVIVNLRKGVDVADKHTRAMELGGGNHVLSTLQRRHGEHDGGPTAGRSFWLYPSGKMSKPIHGGNHEEAARGVLQAHGIPHGDHPTETLMKHSGAMLLVSHRGGEGAHIHGHPPITRPQAESASNFAERHIAEGAPVRYTLHHGGQTKECRSVQHMTAESLRTSVSKAATTYAPIADDSYVAGQHDADPTAEVDRLGLDPGLDANGLFGDELQSVI